MTRRYSEDGSALGIELCSAGDDECLPRPPGDCSAEACYARPGEQAEGSPSRRQEQSARGKTSGRQFLWPTTDSLYSKSADLAAAFPVPPAVVCTPFADGAGENTMLTLSDTHAEGPLRCHRCRAYINSHFVLLRGSPPRLRCNMCDYCMELPEAFVLDMERNGQCADEDNHPELVFGSVDFSAPEAYDEDRPTGSTAPALCVAVEASDEAAGSGLTAAALTAVRELIGTAEEGPLISRKVCFILYDAAVHFFAPTKTGRMKAVTMLDVDDPYLPISSHAVLVNPADDAERAGLLELIGNLEERLHAGGGLGLSVPQLGPDGEEEVAAGAALRLGIEALSKVGGGDLLMFHASNPSRGLGALVPDVIGFPSGSGSASASGSPVAASPSSGWLLQQPPPAASTPLSSRLRLPGALRLRTEGLLISPPSRSSASACGSPTAATPRTPRTPKTPKTPSRKQEVGAAPLPPLQGRFFEDCLAMCLQGGVAVSCITAPAPTAPPMDVPILQWLPTRTGGDTLHLPNFVAAHAPMIGEALRHWAEKMQASAYGCVVKLRCSKGLGCLSLLAPWPAAPSANDGSAFEVARLTPDTTFQFMLRLEPEPEVEEEYQPYARRTDLGRKQVFAQVAILHTNCMGERLLRVHNTLINLVPSIRAVYQSIHVAPVMAIVVKQAAALALEQTDPTALKTLPRDFLLDFCTRTVGAYTRHCQCGEFRTKMLVVGRQIMLLPLYILTARKLLYTVTSNQQDQVRGDDFLRRVIKMPVHTIMAALYPRVYPLPAGNSKGPLPPAGRATRRILESGSAPAYLIANSFGTWFYHAEQEGVAASEATTANPERTPERRPSNTSAVELWKSAEELTQRLRESLAPGPVWMPLRRLPRLPEKSKKALDLGVCWTDKILLSGLFVEDEGVTEMNYPDWLVFVHREAYGGVGD